MTKLTLSKEDALRSASSPTQKASNFAWLHTDAHASVRQSEKPCELCWWVLKVYTPQEDTQSSCWEMK